MTPNRPYLIRALNEWILENGLTPHIVVDASSEGMDLPRDFVENNQITLNIHPQAVQDLVIDNQFIDFNARFGGVSRKIHIPVTAILAIYARENNRGMFFPDETEDNESTREQTKARKPDLKIVR